MLIQFVKTILNTLLNEATILLLGRNLKATNGKASIIAITGSIIAQWFKMNFITSLIIPAFESV